ncbi:unnamed protein product [Ectocarpus fasciculatus]
MSSNNWFRDTCTVKVGDVVKDSAPIRAVDCRTTVAATLDVLSEQGVTTIAVHGEVGHWLGEAKLVCGKRQYIGMVSILDILSYLLKHADGLEHHLSSRITEAIGSTTETLTVWTEDTERPLFFCMEQFCRGTHHAFCVGPAGTEPMMLSQSDLVSYLLNNETAMPHIGAALDRPVESIASAASDFIGGGDKLLVAVQQLLRHHAVPVVDGNGSVLSTLSASDMKGQLGTMVALMAPMTVVEYLQYRNNGVVPAPFTVAPTTTVREAARAMLMRRMHRVWLQPGAEGTLPGVLSLTDVIRVIFTAELPP